MTDPRFMELLDACVREIRGGRKSLSECVAEHPAERAELEALLPAVLAIAPPPGEIDAQGKLLARQRFVEALYQEPRMSWWQQFIAALLPSHRVLRMGLSMAVMLLVMASGLVTAAVASQDAKPGDLLYPVRTAIEDVQVATAGPPEARARTRIAIASQHLAEVERAIETQSDENARRVAAAYEDALARAKAELERSRVSPEAAPELDQALENTLRRQERLAERARERGASSTGETLERAGEQLAVRPDVPTPGPTPAQPAVSQATEAPTSVAPATLPTAATVAPTAEATSGALVQVPGTSILSPTPVPTATRPTPGSIRGVIVPPREIAQVPQVLQAPAENGRPAANSVAPPTPTTMIGLPGIAAPDPRGPIIMPPVPPRAGPDLTDPRVLLTPVPLATNPFDSARGGETRAAPSRPEDPRPQAPDRPGTEPGEIPGPRVPPDLRDPRFGGPGAMQPPVVPPAPAFGAAPPVQPMPPVPAPASAPAAMAPPTVPSAVAAAPASAGTGAAAAAGPAGPGMLVAPTPPPPTRTPTATAVVVPTAVPTATVQSVQRPPSGGATSASGASQATGSIEGSESPRP